MTDATKPENPTESVALDELKEWQTKVKEAEAYLEAHKEAVHVAKFLAGKITAKYSLKPTDIVDENTGAISRGG
jgi:hypothetical protein